jgi:hypothetical protein
MFPKDLGCSKLFSMTLINEVLQFSIKDLRLLNYFTGLSYKGGMVSWKRGNERTASINIKVNTIDASPYIELDYKSSQTPLNYRIQLISIPSNLGKGIVWFFICPSTGKVCRKLYLADKHFVSRFAFINAMYEQQTKSHKARNLDKVFGCFKADELHEKINSKHFKTHYADKPTKRYLRLLKRIKQSEQQTMALSEVQRMFR